VAYGNAGGGGVIQYMTYIAYNGSGENKMASKLVSMKMKNGKRHNQPLSIAKTSKQRMAA